MPVKTNVFASSGTSPNGPVPASHLDVHTGGFGGTDGSPVQSGGGKAHRRSGAYGRLRRFQWLRWFGVWQWETSGGRNCRFRKRHRAKPRASPGWSKVAAASETSRRKFCGSSSPSIRTRRERKKLEGNVTLEVIFHATGQVEVLRVRSGLGSGLDQSARAAAEQIRFRPGKKDGVPVDKPGLVLITFELS